MHDRLKSRRAIPAVGKLLEKFAAPDLPRPLIAQIIRREVARERAAGLTSEPVETRISRALADLRRSRLQPVINGTGVIVHTNFGRAPLAAEALEAVNEVARGYSNLEFDLGRGERGQRGEYLEQALALLCGAEAAAVVNNCAAALVLIAQHFTRAKPEIVISRGELVQIGGGFRVGEILGASGARLREVGATNMTTLADYARAIGRETAMILKVHRSNFFMEGFVAAPLPNELSELARRKRVLFVEDLGSGAIAASETAGLAEHEPTPVESIRQGADLVCFSGDKLFGGPQAGVIVGKKRHVAALKHDPMFRAFRCDKLILAALQATTELHLQRRAESIPIWRILRTSVADLETRAQKIAASLTELPAEITVESSVSQIGGGALPRSQIASVAIALRPREISVEELAARLRAASPAVVGYIARKSFRLDLRTIFPEQDARLLAALRTVFA